MNKSTRAPRFRRRFKIAVENHPAFTIDVGPGGFCAELMRVLAPGTTVSGSIHVRGHEFAFAGRVAWAKAGDARMNLRGRMGVAFTAIPQDFPAWIQ